MMGAFQRVISAAIVVLVTLSVAVAADFQGGKDGKKSWKTYTVFDYAEGGSNCYRIPSLVTCNDGSLLAFAETRWHTWKDKSRTDVVVRRSVDGGRNWSPIVNLTHGTKGAFMDPTTVVDSITGEVFLFVSFWPEDDHSMKSNRSFMITTKDNGLSWGELREITSEIAPGDLRLSGYGPGMGVQIGSGKYKGRLLVPTRIYDMNEDEVAIRSYYSDDNGASWQLGEAIGCDTDEVQYAVTDKGVVVANVRGPGARYVSRSTDGGVSWGKSKVDKGLPTVSNGCQSSVISRGGTMWYCGITGRQGDKVHDQRADLTLFESQDGGKSWDKGQLLYDEASGYSCMTFLNNGAMVILYEAADTPGFVLDRGRKEWMRLEVAVFE